MGKADYFKPNSWNVLCDRCGFKRKREDVRFTWDNLLVCIDTCWEPRHPQDFVRGKLDIQRVPEARPDSQQYYANTTLAANASMHQTSLTVSDISNIARYDGIGIALDTGEVHWSFVSTAPSGSTVVINDGLRGAAASGNTVYLTGGTNFIGTNTQTATML